MNYHPKPRMEQRHDEVVTNADDVEHVIVVEK
jgi:hypothetical protein